MLDKHASELLMGSHWPHGPAMAPLLLLRKPENIAKVAEGGAPGKEYVDTSCNADELLTIAGCEKGANTRDHNLHL